MFLFPEIHFHLFRMSHKNPCLISSLFNNQIITFEATTLWHFLQCDSCVVLVLSFLFSAGKLTLANKMVMIHFIIVTDLGKFLLIILINIPTTFSYDYLVYLLIIIDNVWNSSASSRRTVQVKIHMLEEERKRRRRRNRKCYSECAIFLLKNVLL